MTKTYHLLLIGIDKYAGKSFQALNNAKRDIALLKAALVRYGYNVEVTELLDEHATKKNIIDALYAIQRDALTEDDVIIYFAGHGYQNPISKKGALITFDGQDFDTQSNRIVTGELTEHIDGMCARNVLLIADCCYSGTLHTRGVTVSIQGKGYDLTGEKQSRWVFTSGAEQPVSDGDEGKGSPFARQIINFLENNREPSFPAIDLFTAVLKHFNGVHHPQTPTAAPFIMDSDQSGMMIFTLTASGRPAVVTDPPVGAFKIQPVTNGYIPRHIKSYDVQERLASLSDEELPLKTLLDFIRTDDRIVLLGNAGSGKSVELFEAANRLKQEGRYIPVMVSFDRYVNEKIEDYLPPEWKNYANNLTVLLLDGFDEVPANSFNTAVRHLQNFVDRYPTVKIVLSCRTNFYDLPYADVSGTLKKFQVYQLQDLTLPEINEYVHNSLPGDNGGFIAQLYEYQFLDIVGKPYFFKLLYDYYVAHGKLKVTRGNLLADYIKKGIDSSIGKYQSATSKRVKAVDMLLLLRKVAYAMACFGKKSLKEEEMSVLLGTEMEQELVDCLPVLDHDTARNTYVFEHNNLQEFLAAQVLAGLNTTSVIKRIVTSNQKKVAPHWVNTLSFWVTIDEKDGLKEILNWLIENDPEVILRFERERIPIDVRTNVAVRVFDFYAAQNLWLASNKFTDKDMATVGSTVEFVNYLIDVLDGAAGSTVVKLNAVQVIRYIPKELLEKDKERLKEALFKLLNSTGVKNYAVYSILNTITELFTVGEDAYLNLCIRLVADNQDEYVRAGLYRMIHRSDSSDRYLSILLDGIDMRRIKKVVGERTGINLIDESSNLVLALSGVKTPEGITETLDFLSNPDNSRGLYGDDLKKILDSLLTKAIDTHLGGTPMLEQVLAYITKRHPRLRGKDGDVYRSFFEKTGSVVDLLLNTGLLKEPSKHFMTELTCLIMNEDVVEQLAVIYANGRDIRDELKGIHEALKWESRWQEKIPALISFESKFGSMKELALTIEENTRLLVDPKMVGQEWFARVFDKKWFVQQIDRFFRGLGSDEYDVEKLNGRIYGGETFDMPDQGMQIIRGFLFDRAVITKTEVVNWVMNSEQFEFDQVKEFYDLLQRDYKKELIPNSEQQEFVTGWVQKVLGHREVRYLIIHDYSIASLVWYFITKCNVVVSKETLLSFTLLNNLNGEHPDDSVEAISVMGVSDEELAEQLRYNLTDSTLSSFQWMPSAVGALRKRYRELYALIRDKVIVEIEDVHQADDLLELWLDFTKDVTLFQDILLKSENTMLRYRAITILRQQKGQEDWLIEQLHAMLISDKNQRTEKLHLANSMLLLGDARGFHYMAEEMLHDKEIVLQYASSLSHLKEVAALPLLLKLFKVSIQADRRDIRKEHLLGKVVEAVFNIGVQSEDNYLTVKSEIERFLSNTAYAAFDLSALKVTLLRLEEAKTATILEPVKISEIIEDLMHSILN